MAEFTLSQVVEATAGTSTHTENIKFLDVSTDTRTIESGFLFVALKGDTFDGHDFINTAIEKGATGAIVEKGRAVEGIVCIEVENTLVAYQNLARYHRRRFDIPVVAITGSSGKTTTKEMVAAVLGTEFNVLKTEKNFNNEIGLPKTLLRLTAEHQACVVEMGMRGLGQIEELALIAEPTMGIITNVGTSHIELLGSREAIAQAKGELIRCLPENSVAILNEDDPYVKAMDSLAKGKTITYGIERNATCIGSHLRYKKDGIKFTCKCYDEVFDIFLPMIGEHNVYDALAAIVAGRVLGIKSNTIRKGLSEFTGTPMRQEIVPFEDIVILNDAYNASFESMKVSLEFLSKHTGKRKIAVLGDMFELGEYTEELHRKVGEEVVKNKIDILICAGENSKYIIDEVKKHSNIKTYFMNNNEEIVEKLNQELKKGDVVLVKASNGMKFFEICQKV